MINRQWLKLPMSRTNFHGPKDVRAIEVRLYCCLFGGGYSDIDHFHCNCSIVVTHYTAAHLLSVYFLFVLLNCLGLHQEIMVRFRASKTGLSPSSSLYIDRSKVVLLLQIFFVCGSVVSYEVYVLSLFVIICSSLLLVVPREGCISLLWHFLGIFTYIFVWLGLNDYICSTHRSKGLFVIRLEWKQF